MKIMNNTDATNYARIALLNLIESNSPINTDSLFYEMYSLFDLYSEEAIALEVLKKL